MLNIFWSKGSLICSLIIISQQVLVAFSTIFIAELAKSIAMGELNWVYLWLFILSLTIVYIPATLSRIYVEKIKYSAQYKYFSIFENAYLGKIHLSSKEEEKKLPYITSEGQSTINMVILFFYQFFALSLNILVSLVALSYILHPILIVSYSMSFVLLSGFIYFTHSWISQSSRNAQDSRTDLLSQLLRSWNNIIINNEYNHKIWKNHFESSFGEAKDKNVKNEMIKQFVSSLGMLISLIPLLGTLIYLFYSFRFDLAFLAIIVATLPRQIQMIQNLDVVTQLISEWTDIKERLNGLKEALIVQTSDPESRINWKKLHFYQSSHPLAVSSVESLVNFLETPKRITLRGENGAGKSTLLKHLKDKVGGYYLPAKPALCFNCQNWQTLSTGEQILAALNEIYLNNNFEKLILLDEWDANLDLVNREKISNLIDELSKKCVIIEVIHRQEDLRLLNIQVS